MKSLFTKICFCAILVLFTGCSFMKPYVTEEIKDYPVEVHQVLTNTFLRDQKGNFPEGDCYASGHIVLGSEEKTEGVYFYTLASYGVYANDNGKLTKVSGVEAMPAVVILSTNEQGKTTGEAQYPASRKEIRSMFPNQFTDRLIHISQKDIDTLETLEMQMIYDQLENKEAPTE